MCVYMAGGKSSYADISAIYDFFIKGIQALQH